MKRFINPVDQFFLDDGSAASGGKLWFYENGSSVTLKNTYSSDGGPANTNPVTLDGEGRVPSIYGSGTYSVKLLSSPATGSVQQWQRDGIVFDGAEGQFTDWSSIITYNQNDIVRYTNGLYYQSQTNTNIGNNPSTSAANWSQITFIEVFNASKPGGYALNANVSYLGYFYRSTANGNTTTPPSGTWESLTSNVQQYVARKTSDQSVISSTTLVDATGLSIVLENGIDYHVKLHLLWNANSSITNGIRVAFTGYTTIVSALWTVNTNGAANSSPTGFGGSEAVGAGIVHKLPSNNTPLSSEVVVFDGIITGSGAACKVQFAQEAVVATSTTLKAKSCMIATKLG